MKEVLDWKGGSGSRVATPGVGRWLLYVLISLSAPFPYSIIFPVHEYTIKRGYQRDRTWTGYGEFTPSYGP